MSKHLPVLIAVAVGIVIVWAVLSWPHTPIDNGDIGDKSPKEEVAVDVPSPEAGNALSPGTSYTLNRQRVDIALQEIISDAEQDAASSVFEDDSAAVDAGVIADTNTALYE